MLLALGALLLGALLFVQATESAAIADKSRVAKILRISSSPGERD